MKKILAYPHCFVCGDENTHGLNVSFYFDGTKATAEIIASPQFEGYRGIYHGGILASLLDEVMIKAILADGILAVTAEMTIRYRNPVRVGDHIRLTGWVTSHKGRLYKTEGEACGENGLVYATGTGVYLEAKSALKQDLKTSLNDD
jgi:uncharacterized protein (TIGR00369 family)